MSKVELVEIQALKELVEEKFRSNEESHKMILEQTSKTNGHVADAFEKIACLGKKYDFAKGGIAVIVTFLLPIFLLLLKVYLEGK